MKKTLALVVVVASICCGCKFFEGAGEYVASDKGQAKVEDVISSATSGDWVGAIVGGVGLIIGAAMAGAGLQAKSTAKKATKSAAVATAKASK